MKKQNAITLVSVVVTIIILIILAGISINAILGENGIITIAKQAKENMQLAQEKEQTKLNELYTQMVAEAGNTGSEGGSVGELEETIKQLEGTVEDLNKQLDQEIANKTELENTITELNGQVENLNQQIAQGNTTIEEQQGTIDNLNTEINSKNEELANKNQTIEQLEGSVSTLNTQVASLNNQITELKKKQATGNAVTSDVLNGKTFSNSSGIGLTGTMANRGTLNWNPTTSTTYSVPAGYYSGGTLNSSGAYNAGLSSGKTTQNVLTITSGWTISSSKVSFTGYKTGVVGSTETVSNYQIKIPYNLSGKTIQSICGYNSGGGRRHFYWARGWEFALSCDKTTAATAFQLIKIDGQNCYVKDTGAAFQIQATSASGLTIKVFYN